MFGAMDSRGTPRVLGMRGGCSAPPAAVLSPESAMASELFDQFVTAGTFKTVLSTYRQICELLRIRPSVFPTFYPKLKAKLRSWKAASLWGKLDKRASHKCYNRGKASLNTRVLVIGAGPCGLRTAIEAQLLGAKVVVIEKRDRFSRNNVLHLWPFVIHDLRNLGGKKFFGKFCAGSIDHISIRQLQLILLKVALLLGVEVHENVSFEKLVEPPEDQSSVRVGWRASFVPSDHPVAQYEFDVLIGSDGKRNTLLGFNRKEFRGKLAIAITANFINRQTIEEAQVQEISGVAFIFNQKFFQDMKDETRIDLENIVYYKDDTHYFVMTAKKQSLLEKGVIKHDFSDTARLLSPDNVDREALMDYARDAADFATNYQMPHLDFAVNHYGQADVAMFDFTSMYAAENACRLVERRGHRLLQGLVGDCLLEPFWPTGSGCARGFLSAFDAAWMIRSWTGGKMSPLQVLAEREAIYRLLAQTTPENLSKDLNRYTLNPASRYPNLNLHSVLPSQVRCICDTDSEIQDQLPDVVPELQRKKKRRISLIHPDALLAWCQRQALHVEGIVIDDLSKCWKDGRALCAIIHLYRPDLIDMISVKSEDAAKNNQFAFDILEREFGIPPVMTGLEMTECEVPDKLAMVAYITQIYDTFRSEIPYLVRPSPATPTDESAVPLGAARPAPSPSLVAESTSKPGLPKIRPHHRKRYAVEQEAKKDKGEGTKRLRTPLGLNSRRRSHDKEKTSGEVTLTGYKKVPSPADREAFRTKMKLLKKQLRRDEGQRSRSDDSELEVGEERKNRNPQLIGKIHPDDWNIQLLEEKLKNRGKVTDLKKTPSPKPCRFKKDEWNIKLLEEKLKQQQAPPPVKDVSAPRPQALQDIFNSKLHDMDARLRADGGLTEEEVEKFNFIDSPLRKLDQKLKEGNLEPGKKGSNRVAAMAQHMATILDWNPVEKKGLNAPAPPPPVLPETETVYEQPPVPSGQVRAGSERCCFCQDRVYLMERLSAEGLFFHRSCFRCDYCGAILRLGNYSFDRVQDEVSSITIGKFYCPAHYRMQKNPKDQRFTEMMKRKHAFLSGKHEIIQLPKPTLPGESAPQKDVSDKMDGTYVEPDVTLDGRISNSSTDAVTPIRDRDKENIPARISVSNSKLDVFDNPLENRTPERVEFENSILALSEDELLTSELEEEELTQKNFGPSQEITTSDDDVSDLSTDPESEDEEGAYIEEIELSLTADSTRKLAREWQQKHRHKESSKGENSSSISEKSVSGHHHLTKVKFEDKPHKNKSISERISKTVSTHSDDESSTPEAGSGEEGSEDEEDDETQTGPDDDTSDDVNTDEEYNYSDAFGQNAVVHATENIEDIPLKADVIMQVPVLQPKQATSDSEDFMDSEIEDEVDIDIHNDNECSEESSTESEEPAPLPPHKIPTIVIDESPPQQDTEQDWAEEMASKNLESSPTAEVLGSPIENATKDDSVEYKLNKSNDKLAEIVPLLETTDVVKAQEDIVLIQNVDQSQMPTELNDDKCPISHNVVNVVDVEQPLREAVDVFKTGVLKPMGESQPATEKSETLVEMPQREVQLETVKPVSNIMIPPAQPLSQDSPKSVIAPSSPLFFPPLPSQSSRFTMDKFRFIAGKESVPDGQDPYSPPIYSSPQKSTSSPKELASNLNEIRKKIENLQKQLPPTTISLASADESVTKSRGDFQPSRLDSKCDDYYESLQNKVSLDADKRRDVFKKTEPLSPLKIIGNIDNSTKLESAQLLEQEVKKKKPDSLPLAGLAPEEKNSKMAEKADSVPSVIVEIKDSPVSHKSESRLNNNMDAASSSSTLSSTPESSYGCSLAFPEKDFEQFGAPLITPDSDKCFANDFAVSDGEKSFKKELEELRKLAEEEHFNPNFITLRKKKNDIPYCSFVDEFDAIDLTASPCVKDLKTPTTSSYSASLSESKRSPALSTVNKNIMELGFNNKNNNNNNNSNANNITKPSPKNVLLLKSSESPPSSSSQPSSDSRFQGYRGSFAEKVRPRSFIGDSIYLKSMDINLQKLAFPSLSKESSQFGGSCGTLKDGRTNSFGEGEIDTVGNIVSPSGNSKSIDNILLGSSKDDFKTPNVRARETRSASPITVSNQRFKTLPKAEKPKKHHHVDKTQRTPQNHIEKVPFVDDENRSIAEEAYVGSYEEVFVTPSDGHFSDYTTAPNMCADGAYNSKYLDDDSRVIRTVEQERARQEARERARMKSDEELGLSPCNYRKRYLQASSLSLGNYEELSSEDFLDDEDDDMCDEDSIHESNSTPIARRIRFDETPLLTVTSAPTHNVTSPLSGGESGQATSSEYAGTSTDIANYMESSLSANELELSLDDKNATGQLLLRSRRATSTSTESSPETPETNVALSVPKNKGRIKFRLKSDGNQSVESEEKAKNVGKKSFFSLFGRSADKTSKAKNKAAKSRSSSVPPDTSRTKDRAFPLLKFGKGKERSSRDKQMEASVNHGAGAALHEAPSIKPEPEIAVPELTRPKSSSEPPALSLPLITSLPTVSVSTVSPNVISSDADTSLTPVTPISSAAHLAPKASVDSFTDTEDEPSKALSLSSCHESEKERQEREKRILKLTQKVHHQQELKRFRTAQEIQRRLQEIEVSRRELEKKGVEVEKTLRKESTNSGDTQAEFDLMQEWFSLIRKRNKLEREDQELNIKLKDLELEARHSQLQQDIRERMALDDAKKSKSDIERERDMLSEMLSIVEKRDELARSLHQLQHDEEDADAKLLSKSFSPDDKK